VSRDINLPYSGGRIDVKGAVAVQTGIADGKKRTLRKEKEKEKEHVWNGTLGRFALPPKTPEPCKRQRRHPTTLESWSLGFGAAVEWPVRDKH